MKLYDQFAKEFVTEMLGIFSGQSECPISTTGEISY
jgi:hypothetical protein